MDAGSDHHPDPRRPLLCLGIPYTTPRASEIMPYSHQELASVPGAFRVAPFIDQVPQLLPLGARGLGHTYPVPKRGRRTLQDNRTGPVSLGLNPQDHQEAAGRRRQTPSLVIETQEVILLREREALATLRRHTPVVTAAGHEPSRRTPHRDSVTRGSLIEASGSPFRQALTHQSRQLGRQHTMRPKGAPAPLAQRAADALFSPY